MSTPIKREDIRKGDRVRRIVANEYVAGIDYDSPSDEGETFELIERPATLPTEHGWYFDRTGDPWEVADGVVLSELWAPYTRIPSRAEVAAEVLAEVRGAYATDDPTYWGALDLIAAKWATK